MRVRQRGESGRDGERLELNQMEKYKHIGGEER